MNRYHKLSFLMAACVASFFACDEIDAPKRIVEGESTPIYFTPDTLTTTIDNEEFTFILEHKMLIEDYTGWQCVNCPVLAEYIETSITGVYPSIVVGLHMMNNTLSKNPWLSCTLADEYAAAASGQPASNLSLPCVDINRTGMISGDETTVRNTISSTTLNLHREYNLAGNRPLIALDINTHRFDDGSYEISTALRSETEWSDELYLQLWIIENGIVFKQYIEGGTNNNYIHNHVLRDAINGIWGESIAPSFNGEDYTAVYRTNYSPDSKWVNDNCEVVAFVYEKTSRKVLNATKVAL